MISDDVEVTCVIPAYNNLPLFSRALLSVLTQRDIAPQIVVTDDSTTGDVRAFVEVLAPAFPAIDYRPGPRTGNAADNWNAGLDHAVGRYGVVLHHDEFFSDPGFLRRAVDALRATPGAGMVVGRVSLAGDTGPSRFALAGVLARRLKLASWTLYAINWIGPPSVAVFAIDPRRRFDRRLSWLIDVDFFHRVLAGGRVLIRDEAACVVSVGHAHQITRGIDTHLQKLREIRLLRATESSWIHGSRYRLLLAYAASRVAPWRWDLSRVSPASTASARAPTGD